MECAQSFNWMEISGLLGGMFQFNVGFPKNLLRYATLVFFIKYIFISLDIIFLPIGEAIKTSPDYKAVFMYSSKFCRLLELIYVIRKFLWYQIKKGDMENLLANIKSNYSLSKCNCSKGIQYVTPFLGFVCVVIVEHCFFVDYDKKFEYTLSWGYAILTIIFEYSLIEEINQMLKAKFISIRKTLNSMKKYFTFGNDGTWYKLSILMELDKADLEDKISEMRELSRYHYRLVETAEEVSKMFSFNVSLTALVIVCNVINGLYNIVTHLDVMDYPETVCRSSIWIIYMTLISAIIISSWNSLAHESNRSTRVIHEIWNECIVKHKAEELNYLQFLALRFHCTRVKFTADEFFALDRTFFHSIVSCVTTYVIILVQIKYLN